MKKRTRRLMAVLLVVVAVISRFAIWPEYNMQHDYYAGMVGNRKHRITLIAGVLLAVGGLSFQRFARKPRQYFLLWAGVVILFAMIHIGFKGGLTAAGIIGLIWKHLWIMLIVAGYLLGIHGLGSLIATRWLKLSRTTSHIALTRTMGLVANIVIMYLLLLVGGLYAPVVWLVFVGMGIAVWCQWSAIQADYRYLHDAWSNAIDHRSRLWWIQQGLLVAAIVYLLYGLQLAFIPYSTAWDANHAYMFFPKIRADNHGLYRSDGPWTSPFIRYAYITQWFSSMERLTPITGIARDTMAIVMNFVTSAIGILTVGTITLHTIAKWFTDRTDMHHVFSLMGGALLLLRLTSGMGAFLVFVDNKTDLGILLLVLVAMLSGFLFLLHINDDTSNHDGQTLSPMRYAIVSGIFFGVAFLGKPTAFIDIAGFVTLIIGSHLGIMAVLGLGALIIGILAALQIRSVGTYLEPSASVAVFGGLLLIPAAWMSGIERITKWLRLMLIWGAVLLLTIIIGKLPYLVSRADGWSGGDWMKRFLLSYHQEQVITADALLAATGETDNPLDEALLSTGVVQTPSLAQCSLAAMGTTMDELRDRQRDVIGGGSAEDNGRYVGYAQRVITADDGKGRYGLLRALWRSDDGCYTTNSLAKALCQSRDQLTIGSVAGLLDRVSSISPDAQTIAQRLTDGEIFSQDAVSLLNEYYSSRTITTTAESVAIPYRWIVPLNITTNRSLQNRSSYYTDIGVVWLPALLITFFGLIRAVIIRDRKLIALTGATLIVWIAWMLVADGIVWYGMGMIIWTIIAAVATLTRWIQSLHSDDGPQVATSRVVLVLFAMLMLTQRILNMARIGSQGAGGPFLSYKQGLGVMPAVSISDGQLSATNTLQATAQQDILAVQFPHYMTTIDYLEQRDEDDGVFIAGTYLQYFLRNQANIRSDNLVTSLRKEMSDSDVCASYLRLRDTGYRTIILDPNIATVVLGEGNQSLKERFIMKEDSQGNRIDDGVLSMMARLVMADYAEILSTNNIGLHYAYALSSAEIAPYMQSVGEDDEVTFRTRLAMTRFLSQEMMQEYYGVISQIFLGRFGSYEGMQDIGRIYGEALDENAREIVAAALQGSADQEVFDSLSHTQQMVTYRYAQLISAAQNPQTQSQLQQQLGQILQQSISSQSQIATFVLK